MQELKRGILIALEGIDGSGKTTLANTLAQQLTHKQIPILLTQEPGKTTLGAMLRAILQQEENQICPKAEFLLYAANRAQHFQEVIIPALQKNILVISDRIADSSLVYQGFGRGLDIATLNTINIWAMDNHIPNLTMYVRISPEVALERLQKRQQDKATSKAWSWAENDTFIRKTASGYDTLYAKKRDGLIVLDGTLPPDELAGQALEHIINYITSV